MRLNNIPNDQYAILICINLLPFTFYLLLLKVTMVQGSKVLGSGFKGSKVLGLRGSEFRVYEVQGSVEISVNVDIIMNLVHLICYRVNKINR